MSLRNYLILCAGVSLLTVLALHTVPGLADTLEGALILFLSTNAS